MVGSTPATRAVASPVRPYDSQPGSPSLEPLESRLCLSAAAANVYAQGATVDGRSLGSWAQAWGEWAYEAPLSTGPLRDPTGAHGQANQPKGVFFLAGSDTPGTYERTVTVAPGTKLFIPVLTEIWITLPTDPPMTIPQIRKVLSDALDTATGTFLTIDGKPVKDLDSHREVDPNPKGFTLNMPADNVFGIDAGTYPKSAIDGIFVMAKPLTPGEHTIHFGGVIPDIPGFGDFALDVTYHVNVVPPGHQPPGTPPPFSTTPVKTDAKDAKACWDD